MTSIQLDRKGIDRALPLVSPGLQLYTRLQASLRDRDVSRDREYQTLFNRFYRVRRNADWRQAFYNILERDKSRLPAFLDVLRELHDKTGRVEASFASKLVATVDPSKPVIDAIVLGNLGYRLPLRWETIPQRIEGIIDLYDGLAKRLSDYLRTESGRYLVTRFRSCYPNVQLTEVKMLDLVLWQTREAK